MKLKVLDIEFTEMLTTPLNTGRVVICRPIDKDTVNIFCDEHKGCMGGDLYDKHKNNCYTLKEDKWCSIETVNGHGNRCLIDKLSIDGDYFKLTLKRK